MILRLAATTAAALALVACGGDDVEGRYDARVAEVRSAVGSGDRGAALASLDALATEGLVAHADGAISDQEVSELAELIEHARTQVEAELPAPTTTASTTTTTAAPTTTPAPLRPGPSDDDDDRDEKEDKGKGNKEDRGRGGDDGDDDDDD